MAILRLFSVPSIAIFAVPSIALLSPTSKLGDFINKAHKNIGRQKSVICRRAELYQATTKAKQSNRERFFGVLHSKPLARKVFSIFPPRIGYSYATDLLRKAFKKLSFYKLTDLTAHKSARERKPFLSLAKTRAKNAMKRKHIRFDSNTRHGSGARRAKMD